jgi:hypothetical protein
MSPTSPAVKAVPAPTGAPASYPASFSDSDLLCVLGAGSNQPETQDVIREGIHQGKIRVVPIPGCDDRVEVVRNAQQPAPRPNR